MALKWNLCDYNLVKRCLCNLWKEGIISGQRTPGPRNCIEKIRRISLHWFQTIIFARNCRQNNHFSLNFIKFTATNVWRADTALSLNCQDKWRLNKMFSVIKQTFVWLLCLYIHLWIWLPFSVACDICESIIYHITQQTPGTCHRGILPPGILPKFKLFKFYFCKYNLTKPNLT